jgi:hypothetical protein
LYHAGNISSEATSGEFHIHSSVLCTPLRRPLHSMHLREMYVSWFVFECVLFLVIMFVRDISHVCAGLLGLFGFFIYMSVINKWRFQIATQSQALCCVSYGSVCWEQRTWTICNLSTVNVLCSHILFVLWAAHRFLRYGLIVGIVTLVGICYYIIWRNYTRPTSKLEPVVNYLGLLENGAVVLLPHPHVQGAEASVMAAWSHGPCLQCQLFSRSRTAKALNE